MSQFRPAKKRVSVSVGEPVRIIRELQGMTQNQLAERKLDSLCGCLAVADESFTRIRYPSRVGNRSE